MGQTHFLNTRYNRQGVNSDFPIQNIPFGVANINGKDSVVSRIGNTVISLNEVYKKGYFDGILNQNCL